MIPVIQKMLAPLQRRVALMVSRCVITMVSDSLKIQGVQVNLMADVTRDGVERFQNYGHVSNPHPGAEGVMVSVGGNQNHGIVIAVDDRRYRLTGLAEGEVALHDDLGQKVYLTRNGMVIDGAGMPINIQNTPHVIADTLKFTFNHDVEILGKLNVTQDIVGLANVTGLALLSIGNVTAFCTAPTPISMSGMKTIYNGHTHNDPVSGTTTQPNQPM